MDSQQQPREEVCDVAAGDPPSNKNPLPIYGELLEKRHAKKINTIRNRCDKEEFGPKNVTKRTRSISGNTKRSKNQGYSRSEELERIKLEAKNLFRLHGLPKDIATIPDRISFVDGIKLREICTEIRNQHWSYICQQKVQFREKVWKLMHVDKIPCGNLRESFAYSFQIYLPEKSHLPIVHEDAMPW